MPRPSARLLALALLFSMAPARAQQNGFDLAGPGLSIAVRRGPAQLPLAAVPSLHGGDRLIVRADMPADNAGRYLVIVAFLRGATAPPPKDWFFHAEPWRNKKNVLDIAVPEGAEQAVLLLAPDAGGGFDAVREAVRGRPGIFVRAAQDLYQASLDRARLDTFVNGIARISDTEPERLATVAPVLAQSLRIKLNGECLLRQRALQAACLTQNRDSLLLQAQRGATFAETLTGTPVDLAYRVAATREGGAGYYSPYIGLARDLARLFGAFRSAQYQYVPALALADGGRVRLQLNTAPSFQNPRSVLVAPLPPIGTAVPPAWQPAAAKPVCLGRNDAVMPLDDASLLFSTDYAHDLTLRVTSADATVTDLPVVRDVERGGIRLAMDGAPAIPGRVTGAVLRGRWGFDPFVGPRLPVQFDAQPRWTPQPNDAVVVGRDSSLVLRGGAPACVTHIALRTRDGTERTLAWKAISAEAIETTLPLARVSPGPLELIVGHHGVPRPTTITLTGRVEASRLDGFTIHAGDRTGLLTGSRLDQVTSLDFGGRRFAAGAVTRGDDGDRLEMTADAAPGASSGAGEAKVRMRDGRVATVAATLTPHRPRLTVIGRSVEYAPPAGSLPIVLPDGLAPAGATLTFSLRVEGGVAPDDQVEIAAVDGDGAARLTVASGRLQRVGADIAVASIAPAALLGPAATGALRIRLWRGGTASDWQPLTRVVRLPSLRGIDCAGTQECTLSGRDLFVIAAIGDTADLARAVTLPAGFVGTSITLPAPTDRTIFLRLHDAPDTTVRVDLPAKG
ncbi:hypothetical protein [Sphingomonas rubra]|uniref:Uncharacterized protein n=1 Tax=Sphingomonas rubra TaxID=634430 RepID=A0A1I5PPF6_9SPHN|nr:hypothetical protein [Sphingomonas rubra]SFP35391.1 hypothetical protein SAMN04488241_101116 [Sphingomonas rubra]